MKAMPLLALTAFVLCRVPASGADAFLVRSGKPNAEIVIAENPPRTTRLAAQELQTYLRKISKAQLRIVTDPSGKVPVTVYVGRSAHTDRLGVSAAGL